MLVALVMLVKMAASNPIVYSAVLSRSRFLCASWETACSTQHLAVLSFAATI